MNVRNPRPRLGFTLLETVIAIGVLAVLLSGFMVVFTPAAEGIRKSINVQQADRLASTVEQELGTMRGTSYPTGFEKSFNWIKDSNAATNALLVYQYRGKVSTLRPDGSPDPEPVLKDKIAGKDYIVVSMVRRKSDPLFDQDLVAVEGSVYLVKCTQLIFGNLPSPSTEKGLILGTPGAIKDPKSGAVVASANDYLEAVIAFSADFHILPSKSKDYFGSTAFSTKVSSAKNPVFSRNLAVRR